jgi:hypothetical protein
MPRELFSFSVPSRGPPKGAPGKTSLTAISRRVTILAVDRASQYTKIPK